MKSNLKQLVYSGALLAVLTVGCGRADFETPGEFSSMQAAFAISPTGELTALRVSDADPIVEDERDLPPGAQKSEATEIPVAPTNGDPSFSGEKDEEAASSVAYELREMEIPAAWDGQVAQADAWTQLTLSAIERHGQELLSTNPADATLYCPRWNQLSEAQRRAFYVAFISVMAQQESRFRSELSYKEKFVDSKGKRVVSRGLLQISRESGNYYGCGFTNESMVHNPERNLACGVKILNQWVARHQRLAGHNGRDWIGGARYWAVLRDKSDLKAIRSTLSQLPYCVREGQEQASDELSLKSQKPGHSPAVNSPPAATSAPRPLPLPAQKREARSLSITDLIEGSY